MLSVRQLLAGPRKKKPWHSETGAILNSAIPLVIFEDTHCCVYFLIRDDTIVYVGQTNNLPGRVQAHLRDKIFDHVAWIHVPFDELNEAEFYYISRFVPNYNVFVPRQQPTQKPRRRVAHSWHVTSIPSQIETPPLLPRRIIEWAIEFNDSVLASREVLAHFHAELGMMNKNAIERLLKNMDGHEFELGDGSMYEVLPGAGTRPRQIQKRAPLT